MWDSHLQFNLKNAQNDFKCVTSWFVHCLECTVLNDLSFTHKHTANRISGKETEPLLDNPLLASGSHPLALQTPCDQTNSECARMSSPDAQVEPTEMASSNQQSEDSLRGQF